MTNRIQSGILHYYVFSHIRDGERYYFIFDRDHHNEMLWFIFSYAHSQELNFTLEDALNVGKKIFDAMKSNEGKEE